MNEGFQAKLRPDLVIQDLGEELVLYEPQSGQAHLLRGQLRGIVLGLRDGSIRDTRDYHQDYWTELDRLQLLEREGSVKALPRRGLLKAAAVGTFTLAVGTPAAAHSQVTDDQCEAGGFCGTRCTSVFGTRICGYGETGNPMTDCLLRCRAPVQLAADPCLQPPCT